MAHPTKSQALVLHINRARVQHYPGTQPIALVNVRCWPFMAVAKPLLAIRDKIIVSTLDSARSMCHHDPVRLLEIGRVHGTMSLVQSVFQGETDDISSE